MFRAHTVGPAVLIALVVSSPALAQESLQTAKDLYASASYEDALGVLTRLKARESKPEVEQYRAFCLIALGRTEEAQRAIESVVSANPMYVPDSSELSPRIQDLFARTRRQLLPEIARRMYSEARAALDRNEPGAASAKFEKLLELLEGPEIKSDESVADMALLTAGFLDLSRALSAAQPTTAAAPPAFPPPVAVPSQRPEISRPIAVSQEMPNWIPPDSVTRLHEYVGAIRVTISAEGIVNSAEIVRPIHPAYDRALLQAARSWRYQPARRDGAAILSEHLVEVRLKPRR